ncbi:hypothetical protein SSX86_000010 [Deinandra increscens subsp. villosa]|uniref:Uncharacterized protein n=1 Tax=Deinandra increscens subsp. villosa TaxID=3103831 RepID=A0AAP0DWZ5_9ASTR
MDQSLISDPREQKWVTGISEILDRHLEIEGQIIPPVSIFQVPETITTKKPEAYKPQHVGLGPYHHFQPGPYTNMEQKKLSLLQMNIQDHEINDFRTAVVDKVEKLVPVIRACYDKFLPDDNVSMAWVFALDGLFLINLLQIYNGKHPKPGPVGRQLIFSAQTHTCTVDGSVIRPSQTITGSSDPTKRLVAQDIMMLENQIPFMVLEEVNEALHSSSGYPVSLSSQIRILPHPTTFSPSIFRSFCEKHSPLKLCSPSDAPRHVEHLLHYMYHSIIYIDILIVRANFLRYAGQGANFVNALPKKEIVQIYEQIITTLQNFSSSKITFPTASKLGRRAGFKFHNLPQSVGIRHIKTEGNKIFLPCVTLNNDSEVILRNLIAYETLMPHSNNHPLTEYMGFMCGLIVSVEDVRLLRRANIIKGELGDEEVAKMFVGMSGSIMSLKTKHESKSELQKVIDEVNRVYESRPMRRLCSILKKLASWALVALTSFGNFVKATWKIVAFILGIVTVIMLTCQAYCDVYGCDKNNVTLMPYASG